MNNHKSVQVHAVEKNRCHGLQLNFRYHPNLDLGRSPVEAKIAIPEDA